MDKIIIIGGIGTALNIAEHVLQAITRFGAPLNLLGFAVDDPALGTTIMDLPVLCRPREILSRFPHPDVKVIFSLYKPDAMRERVDLLHSYGFPDDKFATFIHPSSYISPSATVGPGTVILSQCSINKAVRVGRFVTINPGVVVEHDTVVEDSVFLAAASTIGSKVELSRGSFVGLNSTVREGVRIGAYSFVGMGANVLDEVAAGSIVFGNPARSQK
jgi:sugar O-acyltransferase (sialic acid O-acetyltransferase NeuD family)